MVKNFWGALSVAAALALCLTGCGGQPVVVDAADLVGEWMASGPGDEIASVTFHDDGTFSYTGMPKGLFCAEGFDHRIQAHDWTEPESSVGTWRLRYQHGNTLPLEMSGNSVGCGALGQFTELSDSTVLTLTFGRLDEGSPQLRLQHRPD